MPRICRCLDWELKVSHTTNVAGFSRGWIVRIENISHSLLVTGDTRLTLQLGDDIKLNWQQSLISVWLCRNPIYPTGKCGNKNCAPLHKSWFTFKSFFYHTKKLFFSLLIRQWNCFRMNLILSAIKSKAHSGHHSSIYIRGFTVRTIVF